MVDNSSSNTFSIKDLKDIDKNKFRIQNQQLHLTYSSHLDPKSYLEWIGKICPVEKYSIVNEIGSSEYSHTHVLIRFVKNFQSTNPRIFDYNNIHPHIKRVTTPTHWKNTLSYHTKQGEPYTNIPLVDNNKTIVEQIWSAKSPSDAIEQFCTRPSQANGIVTIYTMKPSDYGEEPSISWYPWQQELLSEISKPCTDDRKIVWYYDPKGDNGKTFLAKHLFKYHEAFITTKATSYHVATMLKSLIDSGKNPSLVVFNFTRQQEEHKIYECIESVKDGLITAQKYIGKTLVFDSPHVVVFANYLPITDTMSSDRWDIRLLKDKKSVPLPLYFVEALDSLPSGTNIVEYIFSRIDTLTLKPLQTPNPPVTNPNHRYINIPQNPPVIPPTVVAKPKIIHPRIALPK